MPQRLFIILAGVFFFISCQKEIDATLLTGGGTTPPNQKPKVGTVWTYRYYIYHQDGSLFKSYILNYLAKSLDTLGGEPWLHIVDAATDTTVFYLNTKTDGLYQYINNSSNLLCKDPASVGDTYNTYHGTGPKTFFVRGVKDTLPTGIGDVPANYYEGYDATTRIRDMIWYNPNAWILRKSFYAFLPVSNPPIYYKYSTLFLDVIAY